MSKKRGLPAYRSSHRAHLPHRPERTCPEMDKGMHDGHRNRLKRRFLEEGMEQFEPHNVLELLLFYSIPRQDTNETAHRLIDTLAPFLLCLTPLWRTW